MDTSKLLRARNDGKVEWNTAEYAMVILASDWLYFSRHGIKQGINTIDFIACGMQLQVYPVLDPG